MFKPSACRRCSAALHRGRRCARRRAGRPVAVISYGFWQRRFGGAATIGKTLTVEKTPYTIVGVTGRILRPDVGRAFDVAIPIGTEPLFRGKESWLEAGRPGG